MFDVTFTVDFELEIQGPLMQPPEQASASINIFLSSFLGSRFFIDLSKAFKELMLNNHQFPLA